MSQTRVLVRNENRSALPFSLSNEVEKSLSETVLQLPEKSLSNGASEVLGVDELHEPPTLKVQLDLQALRELARDWRLSHSDLLLVLMAEASILNLVEKSEIKIDLDESTHHSLEREWQLPEWSLDALGKTQVDVRAYVVLDVDRAGAAVGEATYKGAVISAWVTSLKVDESTPWFTPKLLTSDVRERLSRDVGVQLSAQTWCFTRASALLQPGSLADCIEVFIEPSIAGMLDTLRSSAAIKLIEATIALSVAGQVINSLAQEAEEYTPADLEEAACFPILSALSESTGNSVEVVFQRITSGVDERQALLTHYDKFLGTLSLTRAAMRGESD